MITLKEINGSGFEVIHYTPLLEQLIQSGKMAMTPGEGTTKITYHDSCYLGRYNDGYEAPRRILGAMSDLTLLEMERSREKSFCCGGGNNKPMRNVDCRLRNKDLFKEIFLIPHSEFRNPLTPPSPLGGEGEGEGIKG